VILRQTPRAAGWSQNLWDGKARSPWIVREYGISLGGRDPRALIGENAIAGKELGPQWEARQSIAERLSALV